MIAAHGEDANEIVKPLAASSRFSIKDNSQR